MEVGGSLRPPEASMRRSPIGVRNAVRPAPGDCPCALARTRRVLTMASVVPPIALRSAAVVWVDDARSRHSCHSRSAPKESVGDWPLAIIHSDALGGMPVYQYPSARMLTGDGSPPLEAGMLKSHRPRRRCLGRTSPWGTQWWQLDGAAATCSGLTPAQGVHRRVFSDIPPAN